MSEDRQPSGAAGGQASKEEPAAQSAEASQAGAQADVAQELERLRQENRALQSAKDREVARTQRDLRREMERQQTERDVQWQTYLAQLHPDQYAAPQQAQQRQAADDFEVQEAKTLKAALRIAREEGIPFDALDVEAAVDSGGEAELYRQAARFHREKAGKAVPQPEPASGRTDADHVGSVRPRSPGAPPKAVTEEDVHAAINAGDKKKARELQQQLSEESRPILEAQLEAMRRKYGQPG